MREHQTIIYEKYTKKSPRNIRCFELFSNSVVVARSYKKVTVSAGEWNFTRPCWRVHGKAWFGLVSGTCRQILTWCEASDCGMGMAFCSSSERLLQRDHSEYWHKLTTISQKGTNKQLEITSLSAPIHWPTRKECRHLFVKFEANVIFLHCRATLYISAQNPKNTPRSRLLTHVRGNRSDFVSTQWWSRSTHSKFGAKDFLSAFCPRSGVFCQQEHVLSLIHIDTRKKGEEERVSF